MSRLQDVNCSLGDIDLGGFDAESDHRLSEHFVNTPVVERILKGGKYVILGRKGSGKSALFRELPRLATAEGPEVISLTPDAYAWKALRLYREQGMSPEHANMSAWKLTLVVEIAARLTRSELRWHDSVRPHGNALRAFIDANFPAASELRVPGSLYKGIESFDLSALGFGVGVKRGARTEAGAELTPAVTAAIVERLIHLLRVHPIIAQVDRIDDAWSGEEDDKDLVVGLLKACKDLNNEFARAGLASKIVVYLRSDIYDSLTFDDSDKLRSAEERITWTADKLRELVTARLPDGVTVDDLFEEGKMRGNSLPFDHMLRRTFLRPREVLQYLQLTLDVADSDGYAILKRDVADAERQYSSWKVNDLKQEYKKAVPELADLIDALRQQTSPFDSVEQLESHLASAVPEIVEKRGARWCSSALWDASVIGARLNNAGAIRFKSTDPTFSLPVSGTIYVHQGLARGLNITERRSRAGGGADDGADQEEEEVPAGHAE